MSVSSFYFFFVTVYSQLYNGIIPPCVCCALDYVPKALFTTSPLVFTWSCCSHGLICLTRHWAQSFPCPLGVSGEARVQSADLFRVYLKRKGKVPVYWVYQLLDYSNKSHVNVKWFNTTFHTWYKCLKEVQMSANIARMFAQCSYSISNYNLWKVFQKVLLTALFFLNIITLTSP